MSETVVVPSDRDVRGTLDAPEASACVVACPPHPQMGGSRSDGRLRAVGDVLADGGVACLRFDYGAWDEGYGELEDVRAAVAWAEGRYDRVGVFGYSFGGCLALCAAAETDPLAAAALAPTARLAEDIDAVEAVGAIDCPLKIVYGERDGTADWEPIVERARETGGETEGIEADHFFVGRSGTVGEAIGEFLLEILA